MATQEVLEQLGDSSSTSEEGEDDASTSSEDDTAVSVHNSKANAEATKIETNDDGEDPTQVDLQPKPKVRIKLTLRPSVTSADGDVVAAAAKAEGSNGIKEQGVNGTSETNSEAPPQTIQVVDSKPLVVEKPSNIGEAESKPETRESQSPESTPNKPQKVSPGKEESPKANPLPLAESNAKQGTPPQAKAEKDSAAPNGTAKITIGLPNSSGPPKKKMKKKLQKLPLSTKRKLPTKGGDKGASEKTYSSATATTVNATVVDSNENVEADAVATVVGSGSAPVSSGAAKPGGKTQAATKKQPQAKPIRLPPMTSPGLLISHAAASAYRSAVDVNGLAKPQAIFEQSMAVAGYTTEGRTSDPHRGSSVQRVVGDMFDSDVGFALNFPELVPKDLWNASVPLAAGTNGDASQSAAPVSSLSSSLMKSLGKVIKNGELPSQDDALVNGKDGNSRKRSRPWDFGDMMPVSLTIPYPGSFVEKRLKYVGGVEQREKAIIAHQEMQEKLEIQQEEKEFLYGKEEGAGTPKIENPVKIPPIPVPPPAPPLSDFQGLVEEQYEGKHPIRFPKGKKSFVTHLDPDCFHVTEGRYFGLSSNIVADPHFVGANAPGIAGLPVSCGSGLATTSTTSGSSAKPDSVLAVLPTAASTTSKSESAAPDKTASKKEASSSSKTTKKTASLPAVVNSGSKGKFKLKHVGPTPTANSSDLRKLIDAGGEMAVEVKKCIIRAAVHASRSGKHGQSFLAPDGKAYPDVSKAFAAHAGLKPCTRCKNNKQGAYHCRLRRKHKELDHDGGNSPAELAALLQMPMEDLLISPEAS